MRCTLGLDMGTTSTAGILIDPAGEVLAEASRPVTLRSPASGWAEEDPLEWWRNVGDICRELIETSGRPASDIAAVGVAGMLPALVLLDVDGDVLRPSIQQSDGRSGEEVAEMRREISEAEFLARTGQGINQQLIGPRLRWLERHEPKVSKRIATVFGSYDFINWKLTGVRAVEQNWALESGLFELVNGKLATDLAELAHISTANVPRCVLPTDVLGHVTAEAASTTGLTEGTPVCGGAADHIASALVAGLLRPGDVLLKFGGSVDILTISEKPRPDSRLYLDHHLVPGLFVPNGCMSTGGSACAWFARTFCAGERAAVEAAGLTIYQWMDRLAAAVPAGADGLTVLPYFLGEKTPLHDPDARGVFSGLSLGHGLAHLWRALLESYAFALQHHIEVFNEVGYPTERFLVCDGGAASSIWMQIVADVLQQPIQCLTGHPGSCLGAAWTAAMSIGGGHEWSGVAAFVGKGPLLAPNPALASVYAESYRIYRGLYRGKS